jgi:hypothetical protein
MSLLTLLNHFGSSKSWIYISGYIDWISDCINRMNLNLETFHKWIKTDFVSIQKKDTSNYYKLPFLCGGYFAGRQVPHCKSDKNLRLVLDNAFSRENQVNSIYKRVCLTLYVQVIWKRYWAAKLTGNLRQLYRLFQV